MKKIIEKSKQSYNRLCIMLSALMLTAIPAPVLAASVGFVKTSANSFQSYLIKVAIYGVIIIVAMDGMIMAFGGEGGREKIKKLVPWQIGGLALVAFAPKFSPILQDIFGITF